jgi:hypothetical protein
MKKYLSAILLLTAVVVLMVSCGTKGPKKAEDIVVSELRTVCDFVDAIEIVVDELIEVKGEKSWNDLDETETATIEKLFAKLEEIDIVAQEKFTEDEAKTCPAYDRVNEKIEAMDN